MSDILETIARDTLLRVAAAEKSLPLNEVKRQALSLRAADGAGEYPFERALRREGLSLICEIKKASPSKGVISEAFPYLEIADDYVKGGADCVSCLTEPHWFFGSDEIFRNVRKRVPMPMLRKDFTVSEYQIYQSRLLGADAVLLILSLLDDARAEEYFALADALGMSALFECRDEAQIERAQKIGARVIGVNNRNLRDFSVDPSRAGSLRKLVEKDKLFVSESGILSLQDVRAQKEMGADACLVGEFCMRADDRVALIKEMKNG